MSRDDERSEFFRAMHGVEPLAADKEIVRRRAARRRARTDRPKAVQFEIVRSGERVEGRADGVARKTLFSRGPIERRVDLHGQREAEARATTLDTLRAARRLGQRRVLVVHGRGLGSEAGPVLKEALLSWLTQPPASRWVMGFVSAPPQYGGYGATLVLLRLPPAKAKRRD